MSKYVQHNQNPFGKIADDCPIRAISQATSIPYAKICSMMGKGFSKGKGLVGDVTLNDISDFSKKYKLIRPVKFDIPFFDYVYRNKPYAPRYNWQSLRDFADKNTGKYVLLVRRGDVNMDGSEISKYIFKETYHVIYADCDKREYYDNMTRSDPGDMVVYGIFKVNEV